MFDLLRRGGRSGRLLRESTWLLPRSRDYAALATIAGNDEALS